MPQLLSSIETLHSVANYRSIPPEEIVAGYSGYTVRNFNKAYQQQYTPVIIPAHNEEQDLPATLLSLSNNRALPVVVDNRSTDNTAYIAEQMGAIVLSAPNGKKMAATQVGVEYVLDRLNQDKMLLTDADTLHPPGWAETMTAHLSYMDKGNGAAVYGESILWHGQSKAADIVMNMSKVAGGLLRTIYHRHPRTHGHNMGLLFDHQGQMREAIMSLSPELFYVREGYCDDQAIADAVEGTGAANKGLMNPNAIVITRSDRVSKLSQALAMIILQRPYQDVVAFSYGQQYGSPRQN